MKSNPSRRRFLECAISAAGISMFPAPYILPASALGADGFSAPLERVRMGIIGCGIHGMGWNTDLIFANDEQQIVALCDVDSNHLENARKKVEGFYSKKFDTDYNVKTYSDFRDLLRDSDVDAVDIVTPDHWHVLMTVAALRAGKDVICEKPTLTIEQGRILREAVNHSDRVYLTASENRTVDDYQRIVSIVRNGVIGELKNIKVLLPPGNDNRNGASMEVQPVPSTLNYDLWLGPAAEIPYIPARLHNTWRWNLNFSGGSLTDWGSHNINLAQWANNSDDTSPVEITDAVGAFPPADSVYNTTPTFSAKFRYANGVTMHVFSEVPGIKFEGTGGWVMIRGYRGAMTASDDSILTWTPGENDWNAGEELRYCTVGRSGKTALGNILGGEQKHFSHCVKNRILNTYYNAEISQRNHTISHCMNTAMYLNQAQDPNFSLGWNPVSETFTGENASAAAALPFFSRPQREGWTFADVDKWF